MPVPCSGPARLEFSGILLSAKIFWDGKLLAVDDLPFSGAGYEFEAETGLHELTVAVENHIDPDFNPLFTKDYDFYIYDGILRSVIWMELPPGKRFGRCRVRTMELETGRVRLEAELDGVPDGETSLSVSFDGGAEKALVFECHTGTAAASCFVPDPRPWSPAVPCLHTVTLGFPDGSDVLTERFGISTVRAEKGRLFLIGEPLFLLGYKLHKVHPAFGYATPPAVMSGDLEILRSLHCNFIRGAHYPQEQEFLELCDELGFLF